MEPTAFAVIGVLVLTVVTVAIVLRRRKVRDTAGNVMLELRKRALHLVPAEVGIQTTAHEAWGVVMDTTYPQGSATLVSLIDGTASIYFSGGGGVIGGGAHEAVVNAAQSFVQQASRSLNHLGESPNEELPPVGYTRFFVLSPVGIRFAEALENDLGEGRHDLSPLFHAGHEVITQLRILSEAAQRAG